MDSWLRFRPNTLCMCLQDQLPQAAGFIECRIGDFVWITTVQCGEKEGAQGRNLRTQEQGWLPDLRDTALRVVTCHGEVASAGQDFAAPSSSLQGVCSLERDRQPYGMEGSSLGSGQTECVRLPQSVAACSTATDSTSLISREPQSYRHVAEQVSTTASSSATAACSLNAVTHGFTTSAHCYHCNQPAAVHDSDLKSDFASWCLQAQGWNKRNGNWRCYGCHSQPQNCLPSDLGPLCASHRDDIFEFPPELGRHHDCIHIF